MSGVTQRDLGPARGTHQWPRRPAGAACPLAAPIGRLGPTGPASRWVFFLSLSFSPKTRVLLLFLCSCCSWRRFFDLSLQPIIWAEILSKYSLVCDSSTPPIRFLIGGLICEYSVVLGAAEMSLHACVEGCFPSFDASLCLGQVSWVVCLSSLCFNPRFCKL